MRQQAKRLAATASLMGAIALGGCEGPAGTAGMDGANGANGTNGASGTAGANGTNGAMGTAGSNGTNGASGTDGMNGTNARHTIHFTPVDVPTSDAAKRIIDASPTALVDDQEVTLGGYHTIIRSGDVLGATRFGVLVDQTGAALKDAGNMDVVADSTDFSSLLAVGSKSFSVTHFESTPGAMYLTELAQSGTGALTATSTRSIDFSSIGGLWNPCAGSVTPWNTHLGSEEYPPDGRQFTDEPTLATMVDAAEVTSFVRYLGVTGWTPTTPAATVRAAFNTYRHGFPVEVTVDSAGATTVERHYALGRMALELATVMPDRRTVYLTDDGTNVGFYMFVADVPDDLSSGTLYAVRWHQVTAIDGGSANLSWVSLGHATSGAVEALVTGPAPLVFSDIFNTMPVATCDTSAGYKLIAAGDPGIECIRLVPGMELAASRLETRRYASYLGATTEFRKEEGITYNPRTHKLYIAYTAIEKGMTDASATNDVASANHIRLPQNVCGGVYEMNVGTDWTIMSEFVARDMRALVVGTPTTYTAPSPYVGNSCDVNGIASPDNVSVLPGYDVLVIGEDTSRHQNDVIWAYDLFEHELTRIQTTPYGSETTSPYWHANFRGFGYLMSVVQHPYGESDQGQLMNPADAHAYVGYIGPFPRLD